MREGVAYMRARRLAREIIKLTQGSAALEGQGVSKEFLKQVEIELIQEFLEDEVDNRELKSKDKGEL